MSRFPARGRSSGLFLALLMACVVFPAAGGEVETGDERLRAGDYAGAVAAYNARLASFPEDRDARYGLARALAYSGDHPGAEREYRKILAADPNDVEAGLGLADVLAWQKEYTEAGKILSGLAMKRPDDVEILLRQGKVALWSGDLPAARLRYERALSLSPGNAEATRGIEAVDAAAAAKWRRELEMGLSLLRISNANPGTQAWTTLRDRTLPGYEILGRADYLHRYGQDEGRGTLGATRKWDGGASVRVEGALSPGADIFSRATVEGEAGVPLARRLAGYAGVKYSDYSTATSWNAGGALEYYGLPGNSPLMVRYVYSHTRFDVGKESNDSTWLVKASHYFTDDSRIWAYYSHGSEGYATGTIDQVAAVKSDTYGVGGRYFPRPRWGIEGNFDWQQRQDDVRYVTFTVAVYRRF